MLDIETQNVVRVFVLHSELLGFNVDLEADYVGEICLGFNY